MQPSSCYKCRDVPQDILMLACNHDLCLACSSERLSKGKKNNVNLLQGHNMLTLRIADLARLINYSRIIKTSATSQALTDIHNYSRPPSSRKNRAVKEYAMEMPERKPIYNHPDISSHRARPQLTQIPPSSSVNNYSNLPPRQTQVKTKCSQHPQQDLLYFCFDCLCQPICPQCVIHGVHKNHQVSTIKKSYPAVKGMLEGQLKALSQMKAQAISNRQQYERQNTIARQTNKQSKRAIQQAFETLRNKLAIKQKQLLANNDRSLQMILQGYKQSYQDIENDNKSIDRQLSSIQAFICQDPLSLLQNYSKKKDLVDSFVKKGVSPLRLQDCASRLDVQIMLNDIVGIVGQLDRLIIDTGYRQTSSHELQDSRFNQIKRRQQRSIR